MISVSDFRNGVTFDMDGKVMQIIEFQHVKPGKGAAFVRVKMRNVITGGVTETTFNPNDKYPTAYIERRKMDYSYNDGNLYYFMDPETFEMTPVDENILDAQLQVCQGERPVHDPVLQGQRVQRRGSELCRSRRHEDRAGPCRQHRHQHAEARYA